LDTARVSRRKQKGEDSFTIEERVEGVVLDLAEFQEILAGARTLCHLQINDELPEGGL
jgi:hypothetical protein